MRELGKCSFAISECGFDNQVFKIVDAVKRFPKRITACRVAGKYQARPAAVELEADRGDRVVGGNWGDLAAVEIDGFTEPDFLMPEKRIHFVRNHAEIRPDFPVEDVVLEYLPGFPGGMDGNVLFAHADDGIHQQRDAGNVIEMRVRDEDVIDSHHGFDGKIGDTGAGVDEDVVIHQNGGRAQIAAYSPTAAQYADLD